MNFLPGSFWILTLNSRSVDWSCAARTIIFQNENLNYVKVCFTQRTFFFQYDCFLLPICLPCVICATYVTKINAVSWHIERQTFASLGLFTWLVCVQTYCVPIATLNQNKPSRFLHLGDAQIKRHRYNDPRYLSYGFLRYWGGLMYLPCMRCQTRWYNPYITL